MIFSASVSENIQKAAEVLRKGGLVAFPTETVYGLGADAANRIAVCRIFEVKKRPAFDPLIVHVADREQAMALWSEVPQSARALMEKFWPGPLTLVLPRSEKISDLVTAGLPTVAVRMPNHEAALALIRALGKPIAAPSANLFGYTSPTSAAHVAEGLGQGLDFILDGGPCAVGVESTVLKIENGEGIILRPGGISAEAISDFIRLRKDKIVPGKKPEAPGMLESHYAPWTKFILLPNTFEEFATAFEESLQAYRLENSTPLRLGLLAFRKVPESAHFESVQVLSEKGDLVEAASNLFQVMRNLDKMNLDWILAEPVPASGIGLAILDRLFKASGGKIAEKGFLC
jgi:L-threonylcarbamoyladenylate synthase